MALGAFRRHRRWLYVFLWIVIGAFIILYIPAFTGGAGGANETLARVGDLSVSVNEFQRNYAQQRQQLERSMGRVDPAMLRQFRLEERALETLIEDRLVQLEASRLGVKVADSEVARTIERMAGLQENGQFVGKIEYRRRLESQGRSVAEFETLVRGGLLREKLVALVTDGVGPSPAEIEREFRHRNEQLKAEYVRLDASKYQAQVSASDDDVKARFEQKKDAYRIPERRVVSYVLIDREGLRARATVTDAEIEAHYREHQDQFRQPGKACVSHIEFKVKAGATSPGGHTDDEAKKLAQQAQAKLKAGADFPTLAKKISEDEGTVDRGGEMLQCLAAGDMPEFDAVIFSLEPGEISDPVRTSHGYHVIRVNTRQEESVSPLTVVKQSLRGQLTNEKVQTLLEQKAQAASDALRRGRSLEEVAKENGLSVAKSALLTRGETPAAPLGSPALVARAFDLKAGETDHDGFLVMGGNAFITLAEIQPPHAAELKDVQEKVKADLLQERAADKAREVAVQVKARAEKDGLEKAASALGAVRKETPALVGRGEPLGDLGTGVALEEAAYALPEKTLSDPIRVSGGWAILRVTEKKPFDSAELEKQRDQIASSLKEQKKNELYQAYMTQVRERFPVERNADAYRRVASR